MSLDMLRDARPAERVGDSGDRARRPVVALVPAFNEERFIGSLVLTARPYVDVVVVIDDGSADRTAEIARSAGAVVVQHAVNSGKAAAVNTGFQHARSLRPSAMIMLDGDGQHCADDIPTVLEPILSGDADIVVGSRFLDVHSDIPAYRQVGQHGLTLVTNLTSGVSVSDSQSGFRAFSARALELLSFSQGGFSIESEMQFLVRDHQLRVAEVPIKVIYAEPAKRSPVRHGMQVLNGILRLVSQTRPLLYFGGAGMALMTAGLILGLSVAHTFMTVRQLAVGHGLITAILCIVGVVLMFAGIILHAMRVMLLELQHSLYDWIVGYVGEQARGESSSERDLAVGSGYRP